MKNFYEILGIQENSSQEDIKKAYRDLAKVYHPDSGNGDEEVFHSINHAYQVLSKPESRHDYDKTLKQFRAGSGDINSYTSDVYEASGKQLQSLIEELVRQTNLTRVKIKREGKTLLDLPIATATAITSIGLIFAPILTILINVGINRFFEMEVKNAVMDKYDEAAKCHETGDLAGARSKYEEALEMSEFFVPARLNLGILYRQLGENRKAEECFKKVLEIAPFGEIGSLAKSHLETIRGF